MKLSKTEIIFLVVQIIGFYLMPLFSKDPMGLVLMNIWITFMLSIVVAYSSNNKYKYLYPIVISIIFLPTIPIYYNSTALVHFVWYIVVGYAGIIIGKLLSLLKSK